MSKTLAGFFVVLIVAGLAARAAWADMDHRCLNTCISEGKTASLCLSECTYGAKEPAKPSPNKAISPHDQFAAPVPSEQLILPRPSHAAAEAPSKDYRCVAECAHSGLQYQLCEQRCAKVKQ